MQQVHTSMKKVSLMSHNVLESADAEVMNLSQRSSKCK